MLEIVNTVVIGALFAIWQKNNVANTLIKISLLTLMIFNIMRLAGKV